MKVVALVRCVRLQGHMEGLCAPDRSARRTSHASPPCAPPAAPPRHQRRQGLVLQHAALPAARSRGARAAARGGHGSAAHIAASGCARQCAGAARGEGGEAPLGPSSPINPLPRPRPPPGRRAGQPAAARPLRRRAGQLHVPDSGPPAGRGVRRLYRAATVPPPHRGRGPQPGALPLTFTCACMRAWPAGLRLSAGFSPAPRRGPPPHCSTPLPLACATPPASDARHPRASRTARPAVTRWRTSWRSWPLSRWGPLHAPHVPG